MNNNKIQINTALGIITVEEKLDNDFPGVYINLEGKNVKGVFVENCIPLSVVEYNPIKEKIQTVVYQNAADEDVSHVIVHDLSGGLINE